MQKNRYTFKKNERLYLKKQITRLMQKGEHLRVFPFFVRFLIDTQIDTPAKLLISVPKKKFKRAVDRNRIKRLVREAYRLNKHQLYECLKKNNVNILLSISYFDVDIPNYKLVETKINEIFTKLCQKLSGE